MEINNYIEIQGTVVSKFEFNHEVYGEKFYTFMLSTKRNSNIKDVLPVMVSERLLDVKADLTNTKIAFKGQVRTYNQHEGGKSKLILSIFMIDIIDLKANDFNTVEIKGYICKQPVYRKTPLGREITDLLIAVNRPYNKTDYIPSICWGRNARFAEDKVVGNCLILFGRVQSREYLKDGEVRVAYELSVSKLEEVEG